MKLTIRFSSMLCTVFVLFSCKKEATVTLDAGAINITNAVIGGASLTLIAPASIVSSSNTISSNNYAFMPLVSGDLSISVGVPAPAVPATIYYTNSKLSVASQTNYSLFLSGTSPANIDAVLVTETYPFAYADSVFGVRFINLAPGSNPINVNIAGNTSGSESANLAYKGISNFIIHPAKSINTTYKFEFRDTVTGNVVASTTINTPYFHNVTLALRGIVGGSPAPGIIAVNNY
jgi:hypothetical protein